LETNENTNGDIIEYIKDLRFNQHKTIREIATITGKSSRDIIALLKNSVDKEKGEESNKIYGNNTGDLNQGNEETKHRDENLPSYTKAYQLFSEGKKPKDVAITLRLSEAEATKYYLEYLRLGDLPKLPFIYEKLRGPQGIGYLIELSKLALAEKMTPKQVLNLLKMANDCRLYNIESKIEKYKAAIAQLRLHRQTQGQELYALNNKIASAKSILNQYETAFGRLNKEFNSFREQIIGMEAMVEQFKVNNKVYQNIQTIAEDKVRSFLEDNNTVKLLEFALLAICEALRQDPQRGLLIEKTPPIQNFDYTSGQSSFPNLYEYYPYIAKDKVLESANEIYDKLVKGLADTAVSTAAWNRQW
jgi:CII-binding regulator of phage lambda lysogenization HflD